MDGRVERNKDILKKVSMDAWNGRNYREEEERWYQMKGSRDVRREEKNHWMSDGKWERDTWRNNAYTMNVVK